MDSRRDGGCSGDDCSVSLDVEGARSGLEAEPAKEDVCDAPTEGGGLATRTWDWSGWCGLALIRGRVGGIPHM